MATLEQFLQTGQLGPIRPGMSPADVIALLGPPQDESVAAHPQILKYGGLQLTFLRRPQAADRTLAHLGLYFGPHGEPIPQPVLPDDFRVTRDTAMPDVRAFLARVGLREFGIDGDEDTTYLILPSAARITFDSQKLQSIHFVTPTAGQAKKQISVSIAQDTWIQLRTLARRSHRSVSELCAEWITQRTNEVQHVGARGVENPG